MALTLDGSATGVAAGASVTATLTTSLSNDIIVAIVTIYSNNNSLSFSAMLGLQITGGGLQWGLRSSQRYVTSIGNYQTTEVWWAYAASVLSSQVITATITNAGTNNSNLTVFGVNGADLVKPFDTNISLPATVQVAGSGGTSSHPVAGISTTNANTFLFAVLATQVNGSGTKAADASFTLIANKYGASWTSVNTEYQVLSSALVSSSQNVFASFSTVSTNYVAIVDAIQQAGGSFSGPAYVSSGAPGIAASGTTVTPSLPGSRVNGNLLLAYISVSKATAAPVWPAGWTEVEDWTIGTQSGSKAYAYVTGSEAAPAITWTGNAAAMARVDQYSGVAGSSPVGASSHDSATGTSVAAAAVTTTRANSLVVNYTDVGQTDPATTPAAWTSRAAGVNAAPAGAWNVHDAQIAASGAVVPDTTVTITGTSVQWLDFQTELLVPPVFYPVRGKSAGLQHALRR